MKELINNVSITGMLVKNNIEEFTTKKGDEAIGGSLVIRTADQSEHEVRFFANKYKKDDKGNWTSEESYFYKAYLDAKETLVDIEHATELSPVSVVRISDGAFTVNDFKGKDGNLVTTNQIFARFINKVDPTKYETTVMEAKFEVEGLIETMKDELDNGTPTGNLIITFDAIRQRADGFGRDASYTADSLIPIRMTIDKDRVNGFRSVGYYEGCFTKFSGTVINSAKTETVPEPQAFGDPIVRTVTKYVRKNDVKSATNASTIYEHELDDNTIAALKTKRKQAIAAAMSTVNNATPVPDLPFAPTSSTPAQGSAPKAVNPFNPFLQ